MFNTKNLTVGYDKKALIREINLNVKRGEILTLIGPNGSGKSTILKSISKHLAIISGTVFIDSADITKMSYKDMSKKVSVVLTDRIRPELMSCFEIVASGRYPYTNNFGKLTAKDKQIIMESLEKVNAIDIAQKDFNQISDGQRQRVMLARAIAQEPEIIILDEPTSFLDIKYKIELLDILRIMASTKRITIIMSLHEIDLVPKISDYVACVKGDRITHFGRCAEIFRSEIINDLYDLSGYSEIFGSSELKKPAGKADIFIVAGNGRGIRVYRELQKAGQAFNTGILFENDPDYIVARALATKVFSEKAFRKIQSSTLEAAFICAKDCKRIINLVDDFGDFYLENKLLLEKLESIGKTIEN